MSNWTHVAAVVRIDELVGLSEPTDASAIFGKECLFESSSDVWQDARINPDKYLPMGSEGSLQMSVWNNPDKSCLAATTISIFGDLRDHESPEEIVEWFKNKIRGQFIRQAVITAQNERKGSVTWTFSQE